MSQAPYRLLILRTCAPVFQPCSTTILSRNVKHAAIFAQLAKSQAQICVLLALLQAIELIPILHVLAMSTITMMDQAPLVKVAIGPAIHAPRT